MKNTDNFKSGAEEEDQSDSNFYYWTNLIETCYIFTKSKLSVRLSLSVFHVFQIENEIFKEIEDEGRHVKTYFSSQNHY